ncbi:MAG TPA: urocanate hydratase [Alphaproteobacteria bacterium]|nr:urocanate hydratase [Alphaproteobacteria bacterium]
MLEARRKGMKIRAGRGTELRCRGWRQEALLRMLENALETAEKPEELVVYMGNARAARDWKSYDRIVAALKALDENETLVIQSGKPVARFRTGRGGPLVIMASGNVVGAQSDLDHYRDLLERGLIMSPGMTAGSWQYIGGQANLQTIYETFAAAGRQHFGGALGGRWIVTAGLGKTSRAQAAAGKMAGAAIMVIEVDPARIVEAKDAGIADLATDDLDQAVEWSQEARQAHRPLAIALEGNAASVLPELVRRHLTPDIATDQTTPDSRRGYVPAGITPAAAAAMLRRRPEEVEMRGLDSVKHQVGALLELRRRGAVAFEFGNGLRGMARQAGLLQAMDLPSYIELLIRPMFCVGMGPCRWIALSGDAADIETIDDIVLAEFSADHPAAAWIRASQDLAFPGLPARIAWLAHGERSQVALLINQAVAEGRLKAPVAFSRDHLDSGSTAIPFRENERMADGSDAVADWPLLNALLNAASGADLVAVHDHAGFGVSTGVTIVADGTPDTAKRLASVLDGDSGLGIARHADAGYEEALASAALAGMLPG